MKDDMYKSENLSSEKNAALASASAPYKRGKSEYKRLRINATLISDTHAGTPGGLDTAFSESCSVTEKIKY